MTVRAVPHVNEKQAKRILKSAKRIHKFLLAKGPQKVIRTLTWYALQRIKSHSPHRTGSYKDGWDAVIIRGTQGMRGRVRHKWSKTKKGLRRLAAIEHGAKPHVIRAVRAKILAFRFKNGDKGFAASVNHPGMKGFKAQTKTERELRRHIKRVKKTFMRSFNRAKRGVG